MRYFSLLRDSVRESLDRKPLIITLIFCSLLIIACASIGYEPLPMEETIKERLGRFGARIQISEVRDGESEFAGGWSFRLEAGPLVEVQKGALYQRAVASAKGRSLDWKKEPVPGLSEDKKTVVDPPSDDVLVGYVASMLRALAPEKSAVVVESKNADGVVFGVRFRPKDRSLMFYGHRVSVLFGAKTIYLPYSDVKESVYFIQKTLAGVVVGWAGVLAGIVLTAAFIPNMLQKGMIDLILSRPVQRWKVFLMKYLGGLTYVFVTAVFLIGGCWLALGLRSGSWSPMFLVCIPLLTFFFAAVHSISAFIGLHKRNVTEAIMVAVFSWLALTSLGFIRNEMNRPNGAFGTNRTVARIFDVAHAVTPPLGEVGTAVEWFLMKGNEITPERMALNPYTRPRDQYPDVRWAQLFGVTGAWMALLLGLSCWTFTRRDY